MKTAEASSASVTATQFSPVACLRRYEQNHATASGARTRARIEDDIAGQAARRLGTLAILTAVTVVGITIVQSLLQPELGLAHAPLFRLSALYLVLASAGLAALQRSKSVCPRTLLGLGLVFEITGALAWGVMENSLAWPADPVPGCAGGSAWIALCAVLIQSKPWKSGTAAFLAALMIPTAHLISAHILGYQPLPWNQLASYSLGPLFIAGWAPFIGMRQYELRKDSSRTQDFGSYHLEELLGRGGMGEVWRAHHPLLRRDAAVKLVLPALMSGTGRAERRRLQQRFEKEAQAIASLRSPHTVSVYDFGVSEEGSMYYVMELLDGLDAERLVSQHGPQPAGRVLTLIRQACESLEEAHDLGLVHRDVKPSNLFICRIGKREDFVKVLDFGLVKALQTPVEARLTMRGETGGTPAFMAPEQVRGESDIDGRADIYSLGAVAYYLLTGAMVFHGLTPMAMAIAHIEQAPEPPSKRSELPIPASLEHVVMACLEKRPEKRPQSIAELISLLDRCTDVPRWTEADTSWWWSLHQPRPAARKAA